VDPSGDLKLAIDTYFVSVVATDLASPKRGLALGLAVAESQYKELIE
jgi:hypothetical protein